MKPTALLRVGWEASSVKKHPDGASISTAPWQAGRRQTLSAEILETPADPG